MDSIKIVNFIKNYFKEAKRKAAIVGVSGGIDSATVLFLCVQSLGPENVFPIFLPYYPFTVKKDLINVKKIIRLAKISEKSLIVEDINKQLDVFKTKHPQISKIDLGNKIARERMSLLYFYARKLKGLVVGTSNKTESLLGYFTLHGDGAWDLAPIAHLYKTQVRQLAKQLKVPQEIINAVPTAGLWKNQTDEGEFGFSYAMADQILEKFIDKKMSPEEIEKTDIPSKIISLVLARYFANRFKLQLSNRVMYNNSQGDKDD